MNQAVKNHTRGVTLDRLAVGVFELAQNLRFAQHHRIEARCHRKQVAHGLKIFVHVDIGPQFIGLGPARRRPVFKHLSSHVAVAGGQQLHAVTGREDHAFTHRANTWHGPMLFIAVVDQGKALAHVHAGSAMIQADKKDITVHGNSPVSAG